MKQFEQQGLDRCSKFRSSTRGHSRQRFPDGLFIRERIRETILLKHPLVDLFTKLLSKVNFSQNFFANCFSRITQIQGIVRFS